MFVKQDWNTYYLINVNKFSHEYKNIEKIEKYNKQKRYGTNEGIKKRMNYLKQLNLTNIILKNYQLYSNLIELKKEMNVQNMLLFLYVNSQYKMNDVTTLLNMNMNGYILKHPFDSRFTQQMNLFNSLMKHKKSLSINKSTNEENKEDQPIIIADEHLKTLQKEYITQKPIIALKYLYDKGFKYLSQELVQLYLSMKYDGVVDHVGERITRRFVHKKGIYKYIPEFLVNFHYHFHQLIYPSKKIIITPSKRTEKSKDITTFMAKYNNPLMIHMGCEMGQTQPQSMMRWSWAENKEKAKESIYFHMKLFQTRKDTKMGIPTIFTYNSDFMID